MITRFIDFWLGFLRPGFVGSVASVVGIAAGAKALFGSSGGGGGSGGSTAPPYYNPMGTGTADQAWLSLLTQMQQDIGDTRGAVNPLLSASYALMQGISPAQMVASANAAGAQYGEAADIARINASILGTQAGQNFAAGQDVYNLGRDPQGALYDRTRQRVTEGARAADTARGLAMSPYSSGNEAQAVSNFNIDWENNLLSRSIAGLNAMGRSSELGGQQLAGQNELMRVAPQFTMASGTVPWQAAQVGAQYPASAAMQYLDWRNAANMAPAAALQSQIIPYLNYGQGSGQNAWAAASGNRQFVANQQQYGTNALIQGMTELGKVYNQPGSWLNTTYGGGGAQSQPDYYGIPYGSPGSMYE